MNLIETKISGQVKTEIENVDVIPVESPEDRKTTEFFNIKLEDLEKESIPVKKKAGRHRLDCDCENCVKNRGYRSDIGESNIPKPEHIGGVLRAFNIVLRKVSQPLTDDEISEGQKVLFPIYKDLFPKLGGEKSKYYEPGIWMIDKLFASRTYDFSRLKIKSVKNQKDENNDDKTTGKQTSEKQDWNK